MNEPTGMARKAAIQISQVFEKSLADIEHMAPTDAIQRAEKDAATVSQIIQNAFDMATKELLKESTPMEVTKADVENWFTYHPPTDADQVKQFNELRDAGKQFALRMIELTPPCADRSAAIRKIREAVMTGNAAIACHTP